MIREFFAGQPDLEEQLLSAHPLGRFALPIDIALSVLYFASDYFSSMVTGQNLVIDGGRSIRG